MTKRKKILLIEDDQDLAELYDEVLSAKFDVEIAHDGKEGQELAKKKPDLILLDILLPSMNGFELLKAFKKDQDTKNIPVIVLTNLGSKHVDDDKKLALLLGAEDYLVKTYHQPQEILEKISVYLPT
ncbi:MAG: hypothetical protein A3C85_03520 [Candidatus Doudnabacteria bacterium RIFCSPHIGHO2_02_FULL_48_21]|uniref:Response regulatory domain-containing protein n=1 Tax=Candidatus Doudnabacteria bacterium RIFCSPLOWO2_02_FULL_48_13 TaxID=1817845 RepID=A0A1F5Q9H1_9BACT|nr:MAG: hypothetical protein A3K05_03600 [Candidatus Doudnabacteria bacterium RIFCSPHIGHO2_01_48_18]OGE78768.1 MAG: hypothetical protein A2668_00025 [Candidatus Doudnabacteria bacterium RIFCSPHIGHO2_01_FULL_48_180]OGE91311.1 MAG: hypothetical protein A3F44_03305 [Candidatus Doudnabacteria bacterium RIFCSPHIGHO2_12_FULL_47_25]OGE93309.1 MAG: hypothetical protein A3C85_03520 [Candidatus Doudnabacteria bacterium RIFCSPHIGHO2_02_FULL_48_21]OGE96641.1 MAG: hypothetical protein A3A83_01575 [Candidatu